MTRRHLSQELLDEAVRAALEHNGKSGVMFLLRERLIREVLESAIPIIVEPLLDKIDQLETKLNGQAVPLPPAPTAKEGKLDRLKDALDAVAELIEDPDV